MNELMSQEEIDALINGANTSKPAVEAEEIKLSDAEVDALGEIGNICMGTAATTLYNILGRRVSITTPFVSITNLSKLAEQYQIPFVIVDVRYTEGLEGRNQLVLQEDDVKVITDLMMGGDGTNTAINLEELHLSAISEVMNQMMGSIATSMADMLGNMVINISPPTSMVVRFSDDDIKSILGGEKDLIKISFQMEIEGIRKSELIQLMPVEFGKRLAHNLMGDIVENQPESVEPAAPKPAEQPKVQAQPSQQESRAPKASYSSKPEKSKVNIAPLQLNSFDDEPMTDYSEDGLDLIMDVPLQITVELGACKKNLREIMELNTGSIIVLDKMAGDLVDVIVNGKLIAKGEVIVIDDNYGVRITEIVTSSSKQIRTNKIQI
ncbi:MAG: flagellar motor switch phosphatase FliY [Bacillota bacterium]|nr:flagellar motor switch phosphatase FliY [Bacillota bacterium]